MIQILFKIKLRIKLRLQICHREFNLIKIEFKKKARTIKVKRKKIR